MGGREGKRRDLRLVLASGYRMGGAKCVRLYRSFFLFSFLLFSGKRLCGGNGDVLLLLLTSSLLIMGR